MSRALTLDETMSWARARGEGAVLSEPLGLGFDIGVFGWTLPLRLYWGRDGRDTLELVATMPYLFEEGELERIAPAVLETNRFAARDGVAFSVAGDLGLSARAVLFLDDDRVSSDALSSALALLRGTLRVYAPKLVPLGPVPLDKKYEEALRPDDESLGLPLPPSEIRDGDSLRAGVERLRSEIPSPVSFEVSIDDRLVRFRYPFPHRLDVLTAARVSGNTLATAFWTEADMLEAGAAVFLDRDGGCSWRSLARAWRALVADLTWLSGLEPAAPK
jgi:hypothetical protein